jgi:hypothetical protein
LTTAKVNFDRFKNDNYPIRITINKNKTEVMDITGAVITMKIANASGTAIELTKVAMLIDAANGLAEFTFLTTDFNTVGQFKYEIELFSSSGIQYTVATGTFKINQDLG